MSLSRWPLKRRILLERVGGLRGTSRGYGNKKPAPSVSQAAMTDEVVVSMR
jgi:hypothetical protein